MTNVNTSLIVTIEQFLYDNQPYFE